MIDRDILLAVLGGISVWMPMRPDSSQPGTASAPARQVGRSENCRPSRRRRIWFSRGARRELARRIEGFAASFAGTYAETDSDFIELSRSLRQLFGTAQSLAGQVNESLATMRDALNSHRVGGADGLAARSLRDLQGGLTETSNELATLRTLAGELRRLRATVESIERVGVFVRTSVFGFAIESARTQDCHAMFGSFVSELRQLADRITDIAGQISAHALNAEAAQGLEWRVLSAAHLELCDLARELERTAGSTAAEAQALLDASLAAMDEAARCMTRITRHAGEAVYFLQFGDIVRQKTEHICAALTQAAALLAAAPARSGADSGLGDSLKSLGARAAAADRILAIQVAQLELIRKEIQDARCRLGDAFDSLGRDTNGLKAALGQWRRNGVEPGDSADPFDAFKADLLRMNDLQQRGHDLRIEARQCVGRAAETSARLADHVEQVKAINIEVHIQALNAIVKTAALGSQGATLSVLSMYVDWLYRQSNDVVLQMVAILESILAKAGAAAGCSATQTRETTHAPAQFAPLDAACSVCREASATADQLVLRQEQALNGSRDLLRRLEDRVAALEAQIANLSELRGELEPWIHSRSAPVAHGFGALSEQYTMRSERDIHERIQNDTAQTSAGEFSGGETNVDLFDLVPATGAKIAATEASPAATQTSSAGPAAAEAPALGDNVELF